MKFNAYIIDFFKRHNLYDEELFKYLEKNAMMIDYRDEDQRAMIGCFYVLDEKEILKKIQVNVPYVYDDITAMINVHELVHGIEAYQRIGKKFKKDLTTEALPILYEKLFILENPSEELIKYGEYLDKTIEMCSEKDYKFALKVSDELIKNYNYDMKKMKKMTKKLSRKYRG